MVAAGAWGFAAQRWTGLRQQTLDALKAFHEKNPELPGLQVEKLRQAGVAATVADYGDMVHCFVYLQTVLPQAHEAIADAAKAVLARHPEARLIALTSYIGDADIRHALTVGMRGYISKSAPPEELLDAIPGKR